LLVFREELIQSLPLAVHGLGPFGQEAAALGGQLVIALGRPPLSLPPAGLDIALLLQAAKVAIQGSGVGGVAMKPKAGQVFQELIPVGRTAAQAEE